MKKYKRVMLFTCSIVIVVCIASTFSRFFIKVEGRPNVENKFYKSILIQKNDTLWDISKEYITDDYKDINEYIEEVKAINKLESDLIRADEYLIVPYIAKNK